MASLTEVQEDWLRRVWAVSKAPCLHDEDWITVDGPGWEIPGEERCYCPQCVEAEAV